MLGVGLKLLLLNGDLLVRAKKTVIALRSKSNVSSVYLFVDISVFSSADCDLINSRVMMKEVN